MANKKEQAPTKKESANLALNAFAARLKQAEEIKEEIMPKEEMTAQQIVKTAETTVQKEQKTVARVIAPQRELKKNEAAGTTQGAPSHPLVVVPQKREPKDIQKQVRVTKSLNTAVDKKCARLGIAYNEVVNQLLQVWVDMDE